MGKEDASDARCLLWLPWYRRLALGLSARTEFVMPCFTINFGIGHNVVNAQTEKT